MDHLFTRSGLLFFVHCLLCFAIVEIAADQSPQVPLSKKLDYNLDKLSVGRWKQECKEHRATGFETFEGPVEFRPTMSDEHPFIPRLSAMNKTAWEQWVFDGTSDDGSQSVMIGLCRDPNYSFFGQGNLHIQFYAALGEGKTIKDLIFLDSSSIFDCGDHVASYWVSESRGYEAFFVVNQDSTAAALRLTTPRFRGNFTFAATAPAHHLDGSLLSAQKQQVPHKEPPSLVAPGLHMLNAIPGAVIKGDIILDGSPLSPPFTARGGGGVLRLWAAEDWFSLVDGFRIIRASAGPYSFFFWDSPSRWAGSAHGSSGISPKTKENAVYQWGVLYHGAKQLMATRLGRPAPKGDIPQQQADYIYVTQQYGPVGVRGHVAGGRSNGHLVHFVSPGANRTWRFEVEHSVLQGSFPLGGERGVDVFGNRVWGGEVSSSGDHNCQYHGSAYSEDALFPEKLEQWRIWFVYSISMASQASSAITNWLTSLGQGLL
ncbi:hypothetical protein GQ53DRAFT_743532 [Thozetella sp. PMI_491]|nr:hypothetical protein GQ53DRAFT_743532 [Thozetella sp. PMI_491]